MFGYLRNGNSLIPSLSCGARFALAALFAALISAPAVAETSLNDTSLRDTRASQGGSNAR